MAKKKIVKKRASRVSEKTEHASVSLPQPTPPRQPFVLAVHAQATPYPEQVYNAGQKHRDYVIVMNHPQVAIEALAQVKSIDDLKRIRDIAFWNDRHEIVRYLDKRLKSL